MPIHRDNGPDWPGLQELSATQAGYFSVRQAAQLGFSQPLLQHHLTAGRLERPLRGIYRQKWFPPSDEEDLVVTWLWSHQDGVFSHETALLIHRLGDALPSQRHLSVPSAWRRRRLVIPDGVRLYFSDVDTRDRTWFGSVPVTTVERTIRDCISEGVAPDLIHQAIEAAGRRRLLEPALLERFTAATEQTGAPT